jgi:hypothetical protein
MAKPPQQPSSQQLRPNLHFIELSTFWRRWHQLGLDDEDLAIVQSLIMLHPKNSPVIRGTSGLRKLRCGHHRSGSGRKDLRLCYVYPENLLTVIMVVVYAKEEIDTIPNGHKRAINAMIQSIETELHHRLRRQS